MGLVPTTTREVIETRDTVISREVMLRIWAAPPGGPVGTTDTLADLRLTAADARSLAADLLHAARMIDGEQVTFKWHVADCKPEHRANGVCSCSGIRGQVVAR